MSPCTHGRAKCVRNRTHLGQARVSWSLGHFRYGVQWLKDERRDCIEIHKMIQRKPLCTWIKPRTLPQKRIRNWPRWLTIASSHCLNFPKFVTCLRVQWSQERRIPPQARKVCWRQSTEMFPRHFRFAWSQLRIQLPPRQKIQRRHHPLNLPRPLHQSNRAQWMR